MACFLGIDGGGTRTTAWLADDRGQVLARAEAGPSNPLKVGLEACQREILRAAHSAIGHAGPVAALSERQEQAVVTHGMPGQVDRPYSSPELEAVCVGLAGVDRPQVHRPLFAWLCEAIPARNHLLTVDAAITMQAALGNSPGIIVISGTGSIAYGRDERGHILRAGGWGIPFDDLGSGYDLGRKAIAAALQEFDGRGMRTKLTRKICRALNLENITQILLQPLTQQQIAALFPLVLEAARRRDNAARVLCWQAGMDLADMAVAVIERLGWRRRPFPVVCAGGVFKSSATIRAGFAHHVRSHATRAEVHLLRREPVEGALAFARDLAGAHKPI